MASLAYDWSSMSWGMRAIVIVLAVALILVVLSPHVSFLKPIAEGLGLTTTKTVYVPINHTVVKYVNQTVPIYINRTVYVTTFGSGLQALANLTGYCSGRIVVLPNNTAWFVVFWLVPKSYFETNPFMNYSVTVKLLYYNSTTHYAEYILDVGAWSFVSMNPSPWKAAITGDNWFCVFINETINNQYYVMACGDVLGAGPINIRNITMIDGGLMQEAMVPSPALSYGININTGVYTYTMPKLNTTYTGIVFFPTNGMPILLPSFMNTYTFVPGPVCNVTLTYAPNPQAALWLPVTTNQTLLNYLRETSVQTFGRYDQYDYTMGFWVWRYPS
jgi:hypothetical protein